jgi:PKD repeat protein
MHRLPCLLGAFAFAAIASAQTITIPNGFASTEGNSSTAYPWNRNAAVIHVQYCFDSSHFTSQSVNFPIVINRLKWRANSTTAASTGGTYATATVDMSTAAFDQAAITTTFATNHGPNRANVYTGPVAVLATPSIPTTTPLTPNIYYVDLTITPFLYDPTAGDLLIDVAIPASVFTGTSTTALDCQTTGALVSRMYNLTSDTAPTGTFQANVGPIIEVGYTPSNGLFAGFTASTTAGPSPLTVNFTSTSFSSDPGGITSYAWDFNGDSVIDSTAQNPSFVYTGCGNFPVSLTVTDASHPPSTLTRNNFISTDDITASFTIALLSPPNVYQLTDTSTPPATAWSWDFNGDSIPDSTSQNPVTVLPTCQSATIALTATRNCKSATTTRTAFNAPNSLTTLFGANNGGSSGWIVMSDFNVLNPCGINICAFGHNAGTTAVGTPFTYDVYVTPGTYVGKDNDITQWRLVASGSGSAAGNDIPAVGPLSSPLHLPFGSFGVALQVNGASVRYTGTTTGGSPFVYSNADLSISTGAARSTLFNGGSFFTIRQWNGVVHYDTCQTGGTPGMGWFGTGCAGTMPVSRQTVNTLPTPGGALVVTWNNLPFNFAAALVGFSNTLFQGSVPLPADLGPVGAPGCPLRVSDDMMFLQFGAANQTTLNVPVPPNPALLCVNFFTQAAVADTVNAFGFVMSEAWAGTVGQ